MNSQTASAAAGTHTVEGFARVVRTEGRRAWLEPEQTTSCGSCASSASCSASAAQSAAPGIGSVASRLEARRFELDNPPGTQQLRVGDRIVIGVEHRALLKAALTAYALPLVSALGAGSLAQQRFGEDGATLLATLAGLVAGLVAARLLAARLSAHGEMTPRFLRRALPGETLATARD